MSGMTRVTPPVPSGSHSRSAPTAEMSSSRRWRVEAMVASRIGSASCAALHHEALDAHGEVARHGVHPGVEAGHRRDEEAVLDGAQHLLVGAVPRRDREGAGAHPGRRRHAALGRTGGGGAGAATGVGVVQEALQHAVAHELVAAAGEALAVVGLGAERARVGGVVDEGEQRRRDRLADAVGERRPALQHRLAVEHPADDPEDGRRHARLEHQREPLRGGLGGAEEAGGAQHGVVGRLVDGQVGDLASDRQAAGDLRLAVLHGEGLHHQVARARPGPTPGCRCWWPPPPRRASR